MSSVTASALIGIAPRYRCGLEPTWVAILHEGRATSWQLFPLDVFGDHAADPAEAPRPKRLVCGDDGEAIDTLRLAVHLWCGDPANDVTTLLRSKLAEVGQLGDEVTLGEMADGMRGELLRTSRLSPGGAVALTLSVSSGSVVGRGDGEVVAVPGWNAEVAISQGGHAYAPMADTWRSWGPGDR